MDAADPAPRTERIGFVLGSRRLASVSRRLVPVSFTLEALLSGTPPPLPAPANADGLRLLSVPEAMLAPIRARYPGYLCSVQHRYPRHFIRMDGTYEEYLGQFSGKTRATLRKKRRRFEDASGGALILTSHRSREEVARFLELALPLSRRTYQARLLDAGLPESAAFRAQALALADEGRVRAFLLRLDGAPVAYLYLPVVCETLVYAHLGYDPVHSALSPGTVLQMAALESLFAEARFRYFDFTEGDGAHKALFGTDSLACASLLLLRPSLANRGLLVALAGFDRMVSGGKALAARIGADTALRRLIRT